MDPTASAADQPASTPDEAAPPGGASPSAPGGADPLDMEIPSGADTFDRAYVEKLRGEARKYRQERNELRERMEEYQVFEQYDPTDRAVWKDMAGSWLEDPSRAADMMRQIANNVLQDPNATPEEKADAVENAREAEAREQLAEQNPTFTPEQIEELVEKKLGERDQRAEQDAAIKAVTDKIEQAGFPAGTLEHFSVLWIANNDPEVKGDLDAAIQAYKNRGQAQFDSYLNDVSNGRRDPITMPDSGSGGTPTPGAPRRGHEFEDARKAADAWLQNRKLA